MRRVGQRVVAADGDQGVDPEVVHHLQHVAAAVERLGLAATLAREEARQIGPPHLPRVGPRGVQHRPARAVDGTHRLPRQPLDPGLPVAVVVRIDVERAGPAAAEAVDLPALLLRMVDDRLDAGVEPRDVAAPGQHANAHGLSSPKSQPVPTDLLAANGRPTQAKR
jgi:hypothetical protein